MNETAKSKLEEMNYAVLESRVKWIVLFAFVILLLVLGIYAFQFGMDELSKSNDKWGQFGDYVGGALNPIFGFLTLIALSLTIVLQSRQLKISSSELVTSRQELELTRQELRRSAQVHEMSEKALSAQAAASEQSVQLATINLLFDIYRKEIDILRQKTHHADGGARYHELNSRMEKLTVKLDDSYLRVMG